jgi:hypothetical protein
MSTQVNPEAATPATTQSFEQSDRNPPVATFGESGGQIPAPASSESRVTEPGPTVSPNAGLQDYNTGDE